MVERSLIFRKTAIFFFTIMSRLHMGPRLLPIQWIIGSYPSSKPATVDGTGSCLHTMTSFGITTFMFYNLQLQTGKF